MAKTRIGLARFLPLLLLALSAIGFIAVELIFQSAQRGKGAETYLPELSFSSVAIDSRGNVWAGTGFNMFSPSPSGVYRFDGNEWSEIPSSGLAMGDSVTAIEIDSADQLYVFSNQIYKFDGQTWTQITAADSFTSEGFIGEITLDSNDILWALRYTGAGTYADPRVAWVARFDGTRWSEPVAILQDESVHSIKADDSGRLWLGIREGDLIALDTTRDALDQIGEPIHVTDSGIMEIAFDDAGRMWIGTLAGQVFIVEDGVAHEVSTAEGSGINSTSVRQIAFDHLGRTWVAREGGGDTGLLRLDEGQLSYYSEQNSALGEGRLSSIAFDGFGNIWVATSGGLTRMPVDAVPLNPQTFPAKFFAHAVLLGLGVIASGLTLAFATTSSLPAKTKPRSAATVFPLGRFAGFGFLLGILLTTVLFSCAFSFQLLLAFAGGGGHLSDYYGLVFGPLVGIPVALVFGYVARFYGSAHPNVLGAGVGLSTGAVLLILLIVINRLAYTDYAFFPAIDFFPFLIIAGLIGLALGAVLGGRLKTKSPTR